MRLIVLLLLTFCMLVNCRAQQAAYKAFTVNDGLPSNNVYRCMEDDKGFLWVATDAGIARFDGKHFQVFTTQQGLPDNEVLAVVKEKNGRIWVNCFKQSPAYFDEMQNRFINAKEDSNLAKVAGTGGMVVFALPDGGVMYYNETGSYVFRNNKLTEHIPKRKDVIFLIGENKDGSEIKYGGNIGNVLNPYELKFYHVQAEKYLDSITIINKNHDDLPLAAIGDGKFYLSNGPKKKCYFYSNITTHPFRFKLDSISIPEPFFNFSFTDSHVYFITRSGHIYIVDKKTLQQQLVSGDYIPQAFYNDSKGNTWISTLDKGLIVYRKKQFAHIEMPSEFTRTNFFSITRKQDGHLLAGNYYGEVIETNGSKTVTHTIAENGFTRQRKIIEAGKNIFTFSDEGINVNYAKQLRYQNKKTNSAAKSAIVYNDSIIIAGYHAGLLKLNSSTQTITKINAVSKRVVTLVKLNNGLIYFGSLDGLYKYDYPANRVVSLAKNNPLLGEKITALCTTPDGLLWMAAPVNGISVIKDDKVLFTVTAREGLIDKSFRSLTAGKPGQVWLGTDAGISIIHYTCKDDKVIASIQNISVNDGLTSNEVNEMLYHNDTMYAATSDGISMIPADIAVPKFNIPIQVINVKINQRDTSIASTYNLAYGQQNIFIRFAGIELSGHFKNVQYTVDENKQWINLQDNTLNLELSNGKHVIQARAVDVNGNLSDKILTITFVIATPFWRATWFWVIVIFSLQSIAILLLLQRKINKNKARLLKEIAGAQTAALEQQAFTSLMNPHFIFNALNSIQHYMNVQDRQNANRYLTDFASLIRKNFEAAQRSFIPLEEELENLRIYLRLEQMRFTNRFTYHIVIDKNLDVDEWMIPTMMLQPLLENALLHGIMRSAIDGTLTIDCKEQDKNLVITITDNGIGIVNSSIVKENGEHKSHGMELIKKRMAALSYFVADPVTIQMSPASGDDKNPGNKVTVSIPEGLHKAWLNAQQKNFLQ